MILSSFEHAAAGLARREPDAIVGKHLERRVRQSLPDVRSLGDRHLPLAGEYFRTITKDLMWDNKLFNDTMSVGGARPTSQDQGADPACGRRARSHRAL
jgi:hypothetical protein